MAEVINLSRETKFYVSALDSAAFAASSAPINMAEVKVLDGYSFSQATGTADVSLSESGATINRGKKTFNVSLDPAEISFSTYIRPYVLEQGATDETTCMEDFLWRAYFNLFNDYGGGTYTDSATGITRGATSVQYTTTESEVDVLPELYLYFVFENVTYKINQVQLSQAEFDFSIDGIAQVNWTAQGSQVTKDAVAHTFLTSTGVPGTDWLKAPIDTTNAPFIRNKLSELTLSDNDNGYGDTPGETVTFPITGGSLAFNNNISTLVPEELAIVNRPVGSFTGTRDISGSVTAYLRVGTAGEDNNTGGLLDWLTQTAQLDDVGNSYDISMYIGGQGASDTRVVVNMPTAQVSIPTINVEDVIATEIQFFGQGSTSITDADEATVTYFSKSGAAPLNLGDGTAIY